MLRTRLTLLPGANGTKKLVEQYGKRLVCVRYRYDSERGRRVKTVELIEEEAPWTPPIEDGGVYLVKIEFAETELREKLRREGARWDPVRRMWKTTGDVVRRLRLADRVANWG